MAGVGGGEVMVGVVYIYIFPESISHRGTGEGEGLRDKKPEQVCNLRPITHKNRNLEHPSPLIFI